VYGADVERRAGRILVAAALVLVPSLASAPAAGAPAIRGYAECTSEGVQAWAWFEDGIRIAVTGPQEASFVGVEPTGDAGDCAVTAACLERAGLAWKEWTAVVGTPDADVLTGTRNRDVIDALGGDDIVDARGGRDVVCAGGGNDEVSGGRKGDVLLGGGGDDLLRGGAGSDQVRGSLGDDVIFGGGWHDDLQGGPGSDAIYGGRGEDLLDGGAGMDACFAGGDRDTIRFCPIRSQGGVRYGAAPYRDYVVQIEAGLGVHQDRTEAEIDRILGDPRSWVGDGRTGFRRVGSGWDFRVYIASPDTVDAICHPLDTGGYLSCRNGSTIALNVNRWLTATDWWPAPLEVYRQYLVNHEVGHLLGRGHVSCPGAGEVAPIMMQQTKGLDGCIANGWVYP
jgi:hypothetical protein